MLAVILALEAAETGYPAYYLDMAALTENTDSDNSILDDLMTFAHPGVLFVLDNIHLNERMAAELVVAWEELPDFQRPQLLLVGRELQTHRGSAIEGLNIPVVPLKARQAEVCGVYLRLAKCQSSNVPEPSPEWLGRWVEIFGGDPKEEATTTDLVAFSAAVLRRLQHLARQLETVRGRCRCGGTRGVPERLE